eukprot:GHVU01072346.1.p2 GENE.GHVU01072346.1~~GHVU01072346.1.p2  ORF type:complete len:138 (-),score=35.12 GHVU01072346.1:690-1073(-)
MPTHRINAAACLAVGWMDKWMDELRDGSPLEANNKLAATETNNRRWQQDPRPAYMRVCTLSSCATTLANNLQRRWTVLSLFSSSSSFSSFSFSSSSDGGSGLLLPLLDLRTLSLLRSHDAEVNRGCA